MTQKTIKEMERIYIGYCLLSNPFHLFMNKICLNQKKSCLVNLTFYSRQYHLVFVSCRVGYITDFLKIFLTTPFYRRHCFHPVHPSVTTPKISKGDSLKLYMLAYYQLKWVSEWLLLKAPSAQQFSATSWREKINYRWDDGDLYLTKNTHSLSRVVVPATLHVV